MQHTLVLENGPESQQQFKDPGSAGLNQKTNRLAGSYLLGPDSWMWMLVVLSKLMSPCRHDPASQEADGAISWRMLVEKAGWQLTRKGRGLKSRLILSG